MDTAKTDIATLFVAVTLPQHVTSELLQARKRFAPYLAYKVPAENWHVTLAFIGKQVPGESLTTFAAPIALPFVPAISITHLGIGKQPNQLWAYVHATPLVHELRQAVLDQLSAINLAVDEADQHRDYIPHIKLGDLKAGAEKHIADAAAPITFPVREVALLASHHGIGGVRYEQLASAPITA